MAIGHVIVQTYVSESRGFEFEAFHCSIIDGCTLIILSVPVGASATIHKNLNVRAKSYIPITYRVSYRIR